MNGTFPKLGGGPCIMLGGVGALMFGGGTCMLGGGIWGGGMETGGSLICGGCSMKAVKKTVDKNKKVL